MKVASVFELRAPAMVASALLVAGSLSAAVPATAQVQMTVGLSTSLSAGGPVNAMYVKFKEEVERRSNGTMTVRLAEGSVLGAPDARLNQVRRGALELTDAPDGNYASIYSDIQVFSMPFLFPTEEIAWRVFDGPLGTRIGEDILKKTGIRVLGWWESGGFKHFSANKPIRTPDDMRGLKIRVISNVFGLPVAAMGGSPTPIPFPELYTSLRTGVVDGQDNSVGTFNRTTLYEVQKYLMLSGHVYAFGPFGISDVFYSRLSPEQKKIIDESAKVAIAHNRKVSREAEAGDIEKAKGHGVQVIPFTPEMKAAFAKVARPSTVEWLRKNIATPGLIEEVQAAVAEAAKAK